MPGIPVTNLRMGEPNLGGAGAPARPFLKWAGGKGRLLPALLDRLPPDVDQLRHVEPFVGGGALFFARQPHSALLADANPQLIDTFAAVRDELPAVLRELEPLTLDHGPEQFHRVRSIYNEHMRAILPRATRAAMFIYLNKTCFNGLYRVNKHGGFNVPFGAYDNPRIRDVDGLERASRALQSVTLLMSDFGPVLEQCGEGDFVYVDPPYMPTSKTSSFTSYTEGGFNEPEQRRLAAACLTAIERGAKLLISQSDTILTRELYHDFRVRIVKNNRALSSKAETRGNVRELLMTSYPL